MPNHLWPSENFKLGALDQFCVRDSRRVPRFDLKSPQAFDRPDSDRLHQRPVAALEAFQRVDTFVPHARTERRMSERCFCFSPNQNPARCFCSQLLLHLRAESPLSAVVPTNPKTLRAFSKEIP